MAPDLEAQAVSYTEPTLEMLMVSLGAREAHLQEEALRQR